MVLMVTLFLLLFIDFVVKLTNICDGDGIHKRSGVSWCAVFEYYSDCVGLGLRSRSVDDVWAGWGV